MSFLLHDSLSEIESTEITGPDRRNAYKQSVSAQPRVAIIEEKLRMPEVGGIVSRPRLLDLLDRSIDQYGATLVSGRAETGKTSLAADYAGKIRNPAWYTIEPADSDWFQFSNSFSASLFGSRARITDAVSRKSDEVGISEYLSGICARLTRAKRKTPRLIVIDNVHHLFDAEWFSEYFRQLVVSLDENARLLMLCRSKPTAPLWRLRSKQMLNVIDENMLDLTDTEALEIGKFRGASPEQSLAALKRSYGRVGTFLKYLPETRR